jgi:hypothetical protein
MTIRTLNRWTASAVIVVAAMKDLSAKPAAVLPQDVAPTS